MKSSDGAEETIHGPDPDGGMPAAPASFPDGKLADEPDGAGSHCADEAMNQAPSLVFAEAIQKENVTNPS